MRSRVVAVLGWSVLALTCCGERSPQGTPAPEDRRTTQAQAPPSAEPASEPGTGRESLGDAEAIHAALRAWREQRPQHLRLEITHVVEREGRIWTGNPDAWRHASAPVPAPLLCEAWVGSADRALIAPGRQQQLAFHHSTGSPLLQVGPPTEQRRGDVRVSTGTPAFPHDIGWSAEGVPDLQALAGDLAQVLDLGALATWLGSTPRWSSALGRGGTAYQAEVRRPEQAAGEPAAPAEGGWGAVTRVEVTLVVEANGLLREVEIDVRRESDVRGWGRFDTIVRDPEATLRAAALPARVSGPPRRGPAERWAKPFPWEQLQHPDVYVTTSLLPGDPRLVDAAHERTTFLLRPNPAPVGAELGSFLEARRVAR